MWKGIYISAILMLPLLDHCLAGVPPGRSEDHIIEDSSTKKTQTEIYLNHKLAELNYGKYVQGVMSVIRNDPALKKEVTADSVNTGKIAEHMYKIKGNVRSELDELKRRELFRIKRLVEELKGRGEHEKVVKTHLKAMTRHLDLKNHAKFSETDLKRLILETNAQLAIMDDERRQRFKEYEMHKLLEFEELIARESPKEQLEIRRNMEEMLQVYTRRKPMHMPASKQHLLKVWEEKDQMSKDNFNIKTFFHMHDLDGNRLLDEYEIKMLIKTEVLDHFDESDPDFDPRERDEELERMREYAFTEIDDDKDHLISLDEFIINSKRTGFDDHLFWETLKDIPLFTAEEYETYQIANKIEVNQMIDDGLISLDASGIIQRKPIPDADGEKIVETFTLQ